MRIIYRNQLPGGPPRETRIGGWLAALIGFVIILGVLAFIIFLLPFLLIGILGFIALIFFATLIGYIWLGFKIGFRELWDLTRLMFGIGFGPSSGQSRAERARKAWEERVKGKNGVWMK
jgi:hypothetical protein